MRINLLLISRLRNDGGGGGGGKKYRQNYGMKCDVFSCGIPIKSDRRSERIVSDLFYSNDCASMA